LVQADVRVWNPLQGEKFDLVVLGDVLYYMDKPFVRGIFSKLFRRVHDWVKPGGLILLAHGFAGAQEKVIRQSYRKRFQDLGLDLLSESVIGPGEAQGRVCCLLSLLRRPDLLSCTLS
jgi:SAM-dependent methyltransferase